MKGMQDILKNYLSREELKESLKNETFKRRTLSFYRYVSILKPYEFRDHLFRRWFALNCFGRVYVANEGINAQMSVPEHQLENFLAELDSGPQLMDVPVKYAIEDNGKSFFKLTIKVRHKIVADGLPDNEYDFSKVGKHLSAVEFHKAIDEPATLIIDMRNHYESEVGRFKKAWCPNADTFKDAIQLVLNEFSEQKDKKILLYCTGGIRCEKASSFLLHNGFSDVSQLYGGIIEYAQQIKKLDITSKFIGKNFVFDDRLGESVDGQIISHCHQCGEPADTHTNCANNDCHLLFIQCSKCASTYEGCCSSDCREINKLPIEVRKSYRSVNKQKYEGSKIFNRRRQYGILKADQVVALHSGS
jgi:UPF0176 protein